MAAFFSSSLGIGRKERKDEGLENTNCKAFKVRLSLFLENFAVLARDSYSNSKTLAKILST